jgi:hypothetical protein
MRGDDHIDENNWARRDGEMPNLGGKNMTAVYKVVSEIIHLIRHVSTY